jgi:hypothetical protein
MTREEQRQAALLKGNDVRAYRSLVKRQLFSTETTFEDVVDALDERLEGARVADFIAAIPGVGKMRLRSWLAHPSRPLTRETTFGMLTPRQRDVLVVLVRHHQRTSTVFRRHRSRILVSR